MALRLDLGETVIVSWSFSAILFVGGATKANGSSRPTRWIDGVLPHGPQVVAPCPGER